MNTGEINKAEIKALFVKLASTRMLLHVITRAMLPTDNMEAREEIDALIKQIKSLGMRGAIGALDEASSDRLMKVAVEDAVKFLQRLSPQAQGH